MGFADAAKAGPPKVRVDARILTIDIERVPFQAWSYDTKPNWIPWRMIGQPSRMVCWAAKWYGSEKTLFRGEFDYHARKLTEGARRRMLDEAWALLDQADIVVTYNGRRFDHKHLNTEFLLEGMPPPAPFKMVDLFQVAKREFIFESHSLDYVARRLGVGAKVHTGYEALWRGCMQGDREAWAAMRTYNEGDITVTEALYDRLRGWIPGHPHVATYSGDPMCNQCGSTDLKRSASAWKAQSLAYPLLTCQNCGGHQLENRHDRRIATTRGVRPS